MVNEGCFEEVLKEYNYLVDWGFVLVMYEFVKMYEGGFGV